MHITFQFIGLDFQAEVDFLQPWFEDEEVETVFLSLCCNGLDASFLADSDIWADLKAAALEAATPVETFDTS